MGVLRSETMCPGVLVLSADSAPKFLNKLGKGCQLQFQDMKGKNLNAVRPYKKYIQRLDEMERILR